MYTEPNIPLPCTPRRPIRVRTLTPRAWLRALREERTKIEIGRVIAGTVPPGWTTQPRTPENRYEHHYLFYAGEAGLRVRLSGGERVDGPGTLAWLPPGVPYSVGLESGARARMLLRLRFQVTQGAVHLRPWSAPCVLEGFAAAPPLLKDVQDELNLPGRFAGERFRSILLALSIEAFRAQDERGPALPRLRRAQAQRLIDYVQAHLSEQPGPADLARELRLSHAYFTRVFRRTFNQAPRQWLVRQRIQEGVRLLQDTDLDIGEIAYRLGYQEPRLFSRQFRQCLNTTPRSYRHRH